MRGHCDLPWLTAAAGLEGRGPHVRCQVGITPGKEKIQLCPGNIRFKKSRYVGKFSLFGTLGHFLQGKHPTFPFGVKWANRDGRVTSI